MTRIAFDNLPESVARRVNDTVGMMAAGLLAQVEHTESSPMDEEKQVFDVYAVLNGRLLRMSLTGKDPYDELSEYSHAVPLSAIRDIEIRGDDAIITVDAGDDEKGPYTSYVPAETARQILQTGESGNPPLPIAESLKTD